MGIGNMGGGGQPGERFIPVQEGVVWTMKKHVLILLTLALGLSALFASAAFADEPVMGGVLRWHEINDPPKVDPPTSTTPRRAGWSI